MGEKTMGGGYGQCAEPLFRVTFDNPLTGKRGELLDNLTAEQAEAVRAKFSDCRDLNHFLPGVQVERQA